MPRHEARSRWRGLLVLFPIWVGFSAGTVAARGLECSDPAVFEQDFERYLHELAALAQRVERSEALPPGGLSASLSSFEMALAERSPEELLAVCGLFERLPGLWTTPGLLLDRFPEQDTAAHEDGGPPACLPRATYLVFFGAAKTAEVTALVAQTICDASACPVYGGLGACAPIPPECSLTCPAAGLAQGLAEIAEWVLRLDDSCGLRNHYRRVGEGLIPTARESFDSLEMGLDLVVPRLDTGAPLSSRARRAAVETLDSATMEQLVVLEESMNGLSRSVVEQGEARRRFGETLRLLAIEQILATPGGGGASFLLAQDQGGELASVREVVAAALLRVEAAGEDLGTALDLFALGDDFANQGDSRRAYLHYQLAYREAARDALGSIAVRGSGGSATVTERGGGL